MDDALLKIDKMCHARRILSLTETRKNQRVHEYYRNYFCAGEKDKETWEERVELGYAKKTSQYNHK